MITILNEIDIGLAERVAEGLGMAVLKTGKRLNQSIPANGNPDDFQPRDIGAREAPSPQLSIVLSSRTDTIQSRKVAILAADGCNDDDLNSILAALSASRAQAKIVAPRLGYLRSKEGNDVKVHFSLLTASSVLFDAVFVIGGEDNSATLLQDPSAHEFVAEAYKHAKAIGAAGSGVAFLRSPKVLNDPTAIDNDEAIVQTENKAGDVIEEFIAAMGKHRNWAREKMLRPDLKTTSV